MNLTLMLSCIMMILLLFCGRCKAAPGLITGTHHTTITNHHPHLRGYAMEGLMKDLVEDLVGEDDDNLRLSKRQQLDTEYGHWRFGKRSNDDEEYGHSRFGRNIE
ncbi:uncharacterized protein LOC109863729 [Pseudomyrmex gracilis]|uniref:uncharacterized protein LOC109863729 n=1 Tax=Pseudomyrmex gracilis TaxID=219809 RepID=UPI000994BCEF|nr:uncharacterized protein LOC109863729 [Pseudomyrmex gracilis]